LIGVERQWRARMAGLRTNALVAAGVTKPKSELHVRALIVQNTGTSDVILRGVETVRTEEVSENQAERVSAARRGRRDPPGDPHRAAVDRAGDSGRAVALGRARTDFAGSR
jgi:hypothetical protein